MSILTAILRVLAFGLCNRCRGGLVQLSSGQLGRFVNWAVPLAIYVELFLHDPLAAFVTLVGAFTGTCVPAWGKDWTVSNVKDGFMMAFWGVCFMGFSIVGVAIHHLWQALIFGLSGVMMAPIYWLCWRIPSKIPGFSQGPEIGEFMFGCWMGLMLGVLQWQI